LDKAIIKSNISWVISPRGMVRVPSTSKSAMIRGFSGVDILFRWMRYEDNGKGNNSEEAGDSVREDERTEKTTTTTVLAIFVPPQDRGRCSRDNE
jgi:hypothetical protein